MTPAEIARALPVQDRDLWSLSSLETVRAVLFSVRPFDDVAQRYGLVDAGGDITPLGLAVHRHLQRRRDRLPRLLDKLILLFGKPRPAKPHSGGKV